MVSIDTPFRSSQAQEGSELSGPDTNGPNGPQRRRSPANFAVHVADDGSLVGTLALKRAHLETAKQRVEGMKSVVERTRRKDADYAKHLAKLHLFERALFSCQLELNDLLKEAAVGGKSHFQDGRFRAAAHGLTGPAKFLVSPIRRTSRRTKPVV